MSDQRYRSRTYWLMWGALLISTALTFTSHLDGSGWVTSMTVLVGAWQARRYADNRLHAEREEP